MNPPDKIPVQTFFSPEFAAKASPRVLRLIDRCNKVEAWTVMRTSLTLAERRRSPHTVRWLATQLELGIVRTRSMVAEYRDWKRGSTVTLSKPGPVQGAKHEVWLRTWWPDFVRKYPRRGGQDFLRFAAAKGLHVSERQARRIRKLGAALTELRND